MTFADFGALNLYGVSTPDGRRGSGGQPLIYDILWVEKEDAAGTRIEFEGAPYQVTTRRCHNSWDDKDRAHPFERTSRQWLMWALIPASAN